MAYTPPYMASNLRRHFADPQHSLVETEYSHDQPGHCNICLLKLAGLSGYGCYSCNIHVHRACAGYFEETTSFFAHPHALTLSRSPGRICNICRGDCPQGSFVYRCIGCGFDAHSLCAMLPARVGSPVHAGHYRSMVAKSSPGCCSACSRSMPMWRYVCSCSMELHIECSCAIDLPAGAGKGRNGAPAAALGSYAAAAGSHGAVGQRGFGGPAPGQAWYYGYN